MGIVTRLGQLAVVGLAAWLLYETWGWLLSGPGFDSTAATAAAIVTTVVVASIAHVGVANLPEYEGMPRLEGALLLLGFAALELLTWRTVGAFTGDRGWQVLALLVGGVVNFFLSVLPVALLGIGGEERRLEDLRRYGVSTGHDVDAQAQSEPAPTPVDADDTGIAHDDMREATNTPVHNGSRMIPDPRYQIVDIPAPRLIKNPRDAELVAAEWMRWMGFEDAKVTPVGADEGIDVDATEAVAQVKTETLEIGRPAVQRLFGVAAGEGKAGLFFSLSGYRPTALNWGTRVGLPLFEFDLQGLPRPVNEPARDLMRRGAARNR